MYGLEGDTAYIYIRTCTDRSFQLPFRLSHRALMKCVCVCIPSPKSLFGSGINWSYVVRVLTLFWTAEIPHSQPANCPDGISKCVSQISQSGNPGWEIGNNFISRNQRWDEGIVPFSGPVWVWSGPGPGFSGSCGSPRARHTYRGFWVWCSASTQ